MELNAEGLMGFMFDAHDLAIFRPRCHVKGPVALELDDERVIAPGIEAVGKAGKDARAIVANGRCLTMHRAFRARDLAAKRFAYALMAEANAEYGDGSRKCAHDIERSAGLMRRAGARRNHDAAHIAL